MSTIYCLLLYVALIVKFIKLIKMSNENNLLAFVVKCNIIIPMSTTF